MVTLMMKDLWYEGAFVWFDNPRLVEWCEHRHKSAEAAERCVRSWTSRWSSKDGARYVVEFRSRRLDADDS